MADGITLTSSKST